MNHSKSVYIILGVATLLLFFAVTAFGQSNEIKWPEYLSIGAGPQGGTYYVLAAGWSKMVYDTKKVAVTPEVNAGSAVNQKLVNKGDLEFGLVSVGLADLKDYPNLRLMIPIIPGPMQFWSFKKTGLRNIEDLNGKRVNLMKAGSAAQVAGDILMEVLDIKPSLITNSGHVWANQMISDGILDAAFTMGGMPHPAISELSLTHDVYIFGITGENAKRVMEVLPALSEFTLPANTYKGQTEPIHTIAAWNCLMVNKDVPEDVVYELTKTSFEEKDFLASTHKSYQFLKPENISFVLAPLHPGAYRYYKEMGIQVPTEALPPKD